MTRDEAFNICLEHFERCELSLKEAQALDCMYELLYPDLTGPGKARKTDPQTSKEAAIRVNAKNLRGKILSVLAGTKLTSQEIADRLEKPRDSISPRIPELRTLGLVQYTGQLKDSKEIWSLTNLGVEIQGSL